MSYTYLTAQQLAEKSSTTLKIIRNQLKDSVFIEGVHYIRPFGGRKILLFGNALKLKCLNSPV